MVVREGERRRDYEAGRLESVRSSRYPDRFRADLAFKRLTEEDTDYSGNNIVETVAESQRACVDFCKTIAGAPFWTWNSGTKRCIVKSSSSGRTSVAGAVSGNRECGTGKNLLFDPTDKRHHLH